LKSGVVLAGAIAQRPGSGGHAWVFLQYLLGFKSLGFDVLFLDQLTPQMGAGEAGRRYLSAVMEQFGLRSDYCLLGTGAEVLAGIPRDAAINRITDSLMLLNVNGFITDPDLLGAASLRVYLDIDPGFAQMWRELGLHDPFSGHDLFVTIGARIGQVDCGVPTCGLSWITTRQPVVLGLWPAREGDGGAFTSVGNWRGPFAPVEYGGKTYGLRVHEFRKFASLPHLTGQDFELALEIDEAEVTDLDLLQRMGWRLVPPQAVAGSPFDYRDYVGTSRAEFMVAKNMYVDTRSGWFSDRSASYLASGKPVLAQDTGITSIYPTGDGLITFTSLEEAAIGVQAISSDYSRHARAARELAQEFFDSDKVLTALLDKLRI
jgi:hypothetical protein